MSLTARIDELARGWRGPLLAALVALIAGLPGLLTVPPLDRDESRFAQASAQMLETGDYITIHFQDEDRFKKPVGIYWLQAASVALVSAVEDRDIRAYRLPSLLGAMLAAAACAWGASAFFGARSGLLAGALLGGCAILSTEAFIAKTDATLCGTTTLAMAALARLYGEWRGVGPPTTWRTRLLFWIGFSLSTLIKGPVGPMVVMLGVAALWAWDRKAPWLKRLNWSWGLLLFALVIAPWTLAITVATDGGFWSTAVTGDLAPKLAGGHEGHGAPPGLHALLAPLLIFPATLALPAAAVLAWTRRNEPGVRFALCWLIPGWLVFEATPTKLAHYTLPTYGALAWLIAAALAQPLGGRVRWIGAGLHVLIGAVFAALCIYLLSQYGGPGAVTAAAFAAAFYAAAALAGALLLVRRAAATGVVAAGVLGVIAHAVLSAGLLPRLDALWISKRAAEALARADLDPRSGAAGPVTVAGYAEPSLVFTIGTPTELADGKAAAQAVDEGRPALVETRQEPAFRAALAALGDQPRPAGTVKGLDYSDGDKTELTLYRGEPQEPPKPGEEP